MADLGQVKPNVREAVPFFGVMDMAASLRFYVDGLGFRITNSWRPDGPDTVRWCSLGLGGASLMLQEYLPDFRPSEKLGLGVSVCFFCEDALAIYRDALAKGLSPKRPFVGNTLWVVSFVDPDGYRIDFESPTDVPEETEYDPALHDA
jgi:lactoylglutathione lyase